MTIHRLHTRDSSCGLSQKTPLARQSQELLRQVFSIISLVEKATPFRHQILVTAEARNDDWNPCEKGFVDRQRRVLRPDRGNNQTIGLSEKGRNLRIRHRAQELDARMILLRLQLGRIDRIVVERATNPKRCIGGHAAERVE